MKKFKTFKEVYDFLASEPVFKRLPRKSYPHDYTYYPLGGNKNVTAFMGLCTFIEHFGTDELDDIFGSYFYDFNHRAGIGYVSNPFQITRGEKLVMDSTRLNLLLLIAFCEGEKI